MAEIIIELDPQDEARIFAAVAQNFNRPAKVPNPSFDPGRPENPGNNPREIDNPESLEDFTNRILREFLQEHVTAFERRDARRQAAEAIDTTVTITKGPPR